MKTRSFGALYSYTMRVCTCGGSAGVFAESGVLMAFDLVFMCPVTAVSSNTSSNSKIMYKDEMKNEDRVEAEYYSLQSDHLDTSKGSSHDKSIREVRGGPRLIRIRSSVALPKRDDTKSSACALACLTSIQDGCLSSLGGGSRCRCGNCAQLGWA